MIGAISSEIRKFFTTRLWWGMAIATVLAGGGFAALFAWLFTSNAMPPGDPAAQPMPQGDLAVSQSVFTAGIQIGYLLTLCIGVLMIGSEYRHKTITATFLAVPGRVRVMLAKVITLLGIGAFYGLISLVASVGVGTAFLSSQGIEPFADPKIWRTLALALLVMGLWALIGLGAGILIPNQVAALLISIGAAWIVLPVASLILTSTDWGQAITPYFPGAASTSMLTDPESMPGADLLSWWAGALVLTGYAAVMAIVGSVRTIRSDIS